MWAGSGPKHFCYLGILFWNVSVVILSEAVLIRRRKQIHYDICSFATFLPPEPDSVSCSLSLSLNQLDCIVLYYICRNLLFKRSDYTATCNSARSDYSNASTHMYVHRHLTYSSSLVASGPAFISLHISMRHDTLQLATCQKCLLCRAALTDSWRLQRAVVLKRVVTEASSNVHPETDQCKLSRSWGLVVIAWDKLLIRALIVCRGPTRTLRCRRSVELHCVRMLPLAVTVAVENRMCWMCR